MGFAPCCIVFVAVAAQDDNHYRVHLRTLTASPFTVGYFRQRFPNGGGRAIAGRINYLPYADLDLFLKEFDRTFQMM
jgi:hypothetical protein